MAKLNMLQCDRCGETFEDQSEEEAKAIEQIVKGFRKSFSKLVLYKETIHHFGRGGVSAREQDLCLSCQTEFDDWWESANLTK